MTAAFDSVPALTERRYKKKAPAARRGRFESCNLTIRQSRYGRSVVVVVVVSFL